MSLIGLGVSLLGGLFSKKKKAATPTYDPTAAMKQMQGYWSQYQQQAANVWSGYQQQMGERMREYDQSMNFQYERDAEKMRSELASRGLLRSSELTRGLGALMSQSQASRAQNLAALQGQSMQAYGNLQQQGMQGLQSIFSSGLAAMGGAAQATVAANQQQYQQNQDLWSGLGTLAGGLFGQNTKSTTASTSPYTIPSYTL
jgi:hypothetical protein